MVYRDKNFLVVGAGRSAEAAARLLLGRGARVFAFDRNAGKQPEGLARLSAMGVVPVEEAALSRLLDDVYCVVLSPGVPLDAPEAELARQRGVRVTGEMELAAALTRAPLLAVTGTNGKSTTVTLIYELIKAGGMAGRLLGNIGVPLSAEGPDCAEEDYICLEVSSFQLETAKHFCPHIATVLNVTPDHLNRHGSMENYRRIKCRVFENQTSTEYAVLPADIPELAQLGRTLAANVYYYSAKGEVRGAYVEQGRIRFRDGGAAEDILDRSALALIGEHNLTNALCAVTFAKLCGVSNAAIAGVLSTFSGIRHRLQYVDTVNGKTFYNDSKGTNIDAALTAVAAMKQPTVLLAGGSDKGYEFDDLFSGLTKNIVHCVLYGDTRYKLLEAAVRCGYANVSLCQDLSTAVRIAFLRAPGGGNVLLSPACASFDQYANFEERGDHFIRLVEELHAQA